MVQRVISRVLVAAGFYDELPDLWASVQLKMYNTHDDACAHALMCVGVCKHVLGSKCLLTLACRGSEITTSATGIGLSAHHAAYVLHW